MTPIITWFLIFYLLPLPLALLGFAVTKKYGFRIEDRFPVDFSFSGRPRNWRKVNRGLLFRLPVAGLLFYLIGFMIAGALIRIGLINQRVIGAILGFTAIAVCYAYALQVGILKVTVAESETIRRPMRIGLVILLVWIVGAVGVYFLPYRFPAPEFVFISRGSEVDIGEGRTTGDDINTQVVTLSVVCFGLQAGDDLMFRWIGPRDGVQIKVGLLPQSGDYSKHNIIHRVPVTDLLSADAYGRWRVEMFVNDRYLLARKFYLNP